MTLTYAIPDLHGRFDLLELAIAEIVDHLNGRQATVVTLGDYVDRGPKSFKVIEYLMDWKSEVAVMINLKGNHEAMMWDCCNSLAEMNWWIKNGGDRTLASYAGDSAKSDRSIVPQAHLQWISDLPLMHVDRHRVYVHAGLDPTIPLEQQNEQTLLWKRYPDRFAAGHGQRHVVHGHHSDPNAPIITEGKTNLDALAWRTGRLVIGVFEDDQPGGASDFLEVFGPSEFG